MAYIAPSPRSSGALITATIWNQDAVANPIAIYAGAVSIASQAANDLIYASSATQLGRLAAAASSILITSAGSVPSLSQTLPTAVQANITQLGTIASSSTADLSKALNVSHTGAITGTGYGGYFSKTGVSTTNVGLYATASGATNNYAAIFEAGRMGIGTTGPDTLVHVSTNAAPGGLNGIVTISIHEISTTSANLLLRKSRGTAASPTIVADGDGIGSLGFTAYDGAAYQNTAAINGSIDGAVTSGQRPPSRLEFYTNTSNGSQTERMRIDKVGNLGIGITPTAVLHVKAGTATVSTAPLKFTSGTLLTTAEAGAVEFLTDAFYGTITTGAARKTFAFVENLITSRLKANSGTDTSAGATDVDTIVISGLTAKDRLLVYVVANALTQATASLSLYNTTDGLVLEALETLNGAASIVAGASLVATSILQQAQEATTAIRTHTIGANRAGTGAGSEIVTYATATTAWTGSWTLALRHGGVTAGGTLRWSWAVYKLAGQ